MKKEQFIELLNSMKNKECPPGVGIDCFPSKQYCENQKCWFSFIKDLIELNHIKFDE